MKKHLLTLALFISLIAVHAQDIHFSQYYYSPLNLNPALTGAMDGRYRVGAIYRNQWSSITSPYVYSTPSVFGDVKLFGNGRTPNYLGVGVTLLDDRSGDGNLQTLTAMLSLAYHIALDREGNNHFSVGLQGGIVQKSVDFSKLNFYDEFDGLGFNGFTAEPFSYQSIAYWDFSAGAAYTSVINEAARVQFGASVFHLTEPTETFFSSSPNVLNMRYLAHASATFGIAKTAYLFPFAQYQIQNNDNEAVVGMNLGFSLDQSNFATGTIIYGGAFYRVNYDIIPTVGFMFKGMQFGVSYDVNTYSELSPATNGSGGFEIALVYTGNVEPVKRVKRQYCPTF